MKKLLYVLTILIFIVNLKSLAQNTSISEQFTDWDNDSGWSDGTSPGAEPLNDILIIDGSVTRIGDLTITEFFGTMRLTVLDDDSLVIDGDLTINPEAELIVEEGGYLYVNGDLNNEGFFSVFTGEVSSDGTIGVAGDYNQDPGATFTKGPNGNFYVNGTSDEPGETDGAIPAEIQNIYNTLPIELKSFEGLLTRNATQLNWITAKEENFSHFEIERSINKKPFESIGLVEGQGNSNVDVYYDFTDLSVPFGIIRYRLKAVDIDNTVEYFDAIEIKNTFSNQLTAYPNPTNQISNIKIVLPKEFSGSLNKVSLFDASGLNLYEGLDFDPQSSKINLGDLKEGMYILRIYHNGLTENLRIFVH